MSNSSKEAQATLSKIHSNMCCVCREPIHTCDTHIQCMRCIAQICEECEQNMSQHNVMFICPLCRNDEFAIKIGDHGFDVVTIDMTNE